VTNVTGPLSVELRGETVTVPDVEHERCAQCGEAILSLAAADQLQREAVAHLRAARGLLTPDEIRGLPHSLGVSQAALERLLGVGSKTVVRWEKGTVFQSATADRLMRLLIAKPELVSLLAGETPCRRSNAASQGGRASHAAPAVRAIHPAPRVSLGSMGQLLAVAVSDVDGFGSGPWLLSATRSPTITCPLDSRSAGRSSYRLPGKLPLSLAAASDRGGTCWRRIGQPATGTARQRRRDAAPSSSSSRY